MRSNFLEKRLLRSRVPALDLGSSSHNTQLDTNTNSNNTKACWYVLKLKAV